MAENSEPNDDLREEYDFSEMKGGVREKYAEDYREGVTVITPPEELPSTG